jgi:hypothetical protein
MKKLLVTIAGLIAFSVQATAQNAPQMQHIVPEKGLSILINPANGTCPGADDVIVSGYCFVPGNRVPFPSMELLGNNRSAACSPPGSAIQMVLVCAKP